jgi:uncharacterized membrane protein YfcA
MLLEAIAAGLAIGVSLGALGGGGSILTVPALVYLLHQSAHGATAGSLVIVGVTAAAAAAGHLRAGRVRLGVGIAFGLLGVAGSYAGTRASAAVDQHVLLVAFAGLMVIAAAAMARRRAPASQPVPSVLSVGVAPGAGGGVAVAAVASGGTPIKERPEHVGKRYAKVAATATAVGLLTGFFGVGGGFVIVPALVLALGFDMPAAIGTSLLVIAINSAAAFAARIGSGVHLDWALIAVFTGAAVAGTVAGKGIADRVQGATLTRAFVVLLIGLAVYVLARSLPALL